ncbi:hypothetical protein K466DRAFT_489070 [Polyporus arcularius HHB13444]|uniref:Glycosyltransferase family 1 protein n=1 Tax=Polyporus arcularius HHB13444 TaxID=1314778 RepID=A0A5C3PF66_9APHY|nr:hypothetical protein K466DRAFT_489070 [Polyporus arcularius HHB13444]
MDEEDVDGQVIHLFAQDFNLGFQEVTDELHLWKHRGIHADQDHMIEYVNANTGDGGVDLLVFGTCEFDLRVWQEALEDAWNRRDEEHKFKIVCGVHHVQDTSWQSHITYWARRDAIRLLPIADHVAEGFREKFAGLADSPEPILYSAGYQYIPVDVHVPILDVRNLPSRPLPRHLSKVAIQGSINPVRRDYHRIFRELIASLHEDPEAWGYHPLEGRRSFVPNSSGVAPPFELLLVGMGSVDIPDELAYVVSIHHDLTYKEFYALVANCDVVLPAFADNGYFEAQASSTVALATELNVPLLVTDRHRKKYGYIDDVRAVITRPAAMPEVQALKALRTGNASAFLASDPADIGKAMGELPAVRRDVEKMMQEGWVRGRREWMEWREGVWEKNRQVARKILTDTP